MGMSEYLNKIYFKLNKSELYSSDYDSKVAELSKLVKLDVMPTNDPDFSQTVLSWSGFADMILKLISSDMELSYENLESIYNPSKASKNMSRSEYVEIDPALLVEEDPAVKLERLLAITEEEKEVLDILDIIDPEVLGQEGLRAVGSIDKLETVLDGYDLEIISEEKMPILRLKEGEEIVSPYTGSTSVYRIDEVHFLDIETDEIFKVFFS